ncbi:MAG: BMP family ABC transporter substrate-binding protein [Clostridia bacterium]|nr:BMP family ABC transporter substrate-binding protein [Clostridia bacterium]
MKKFLALFLALILASVSLLSFAGCQPNEEGEGESNFKVGAIYINSKNDTAGYTFAHHNGITTAMKQLGLNPDTQLFIVDEVPEDKEQVLAAIDTLVGNGVNIIFGISFGYIDAMEEAAGKYPDVIFSHATGYKSNETNFNNYFGRAYQARYLAGIAAGLKSLETGNNNVGYVAAYATEYAETASGINGFALGVQAVNPDAVLYVKSLSAWADEVNEKAYANELIASFNCGIISQHCDSAQPQIAAEAANVFGCGYNSDMTADAPKAHLTAAIWHWDVYYKTAMQAAMDCEKAADFVTKMGGQAYYGGLKEEFVDVSPLNSTCAANTDKAIAAVRELIVSGEWDVFSGVKLSISADGTVTKSDAALVDNKGNEIVAAGGASVADGVITGTMNYFVKGITWVNDPNGSTTPDTDPDTSADASEEVSE